MGRGQTVDASFHMHSSNDDLQQFDGLENLLCVKALSLSSQECISQQNHHEDRHAMLRENAKNARATSQTL